MIQSLNSKMTQPIASFATRGAAPGGILAKMIVSCITRLENVNLQVVGVVCDGAATNKSAWKELGIGVKDGAVINKITNPADESRNVFFFTDVPHVLKCIRNNLLKKEIAMYKGGIVNWAFYKALYDVDSQSDIRAAPKLTLQHVNPGPFQKMVVSHAAQIFSNSVASALKFYRECGNPFFKGSELTEEFTRTINDLFDACNGRRIGQGLKPGSDKFKVISDFLKSISDEDTYAAEVTFVSLRVTLTSIIEITVYLCDVVGYEYVLPGKLNQDKLERFFGLIRSYGGDDSHPTVTSFAHLFRLLTIYSPTDKIIHGNVKTDNESSLAVTAYVDALKSLRKSVIAKNKDSRELLEETLLSKLFCGEADQNVLQVVLHDHSYCLPSPLRSITYKLCGFVAFKAKSFSKCHSCVESLVDRNPSTSDMLFTKLKDCGRLTYPSLALVRLLCDDIEPVLDKKLITIDDPMLFVQSFLAELDNVNIVGIGCSVDHSSKLVVSIVFYYVTIRAWFFTKNKNKEDLRGRLAKKNKMKMAKTT
ncbi:unnamed protein product [Orchesella dallaii]